MLLKTESTVVTCAHCGDDCHEAQSSQELAFCCTGCKLVFELLQENDFQNYYCLNETPGITITKTAANTYAAFDEEQYANNYISFKSDKKAVAFFYLPQIHCSSCLWLLEHLSRLEEGVLGSSVNFITKTISVTFDANKISLRQLAELLAFLGYAPQLQEVDGDVTKEKSQKTELIKIGIAFFCFANIMLFSFPEYLGLNAADDSRFISFFRYGSLLLSLPVVFYCAADFFINAFKGLRKQYVNIDAPIVLAIIVCFVRSIVDIFSGTGSGYLDSMTAIVLLMLVGRLLQNKTFRSMRFDRSLRSFFPIGVAVRKDNNISYARVETLTKGDIIMLRQEEVIPLDCMVSKGSIDVNNSFITGEADTLIASEGDIVFAGGKVVAGAGEAIVVKPFSANHFLNLWQQSSNSDTGFIPGQFTDKLSRYFSVGLLSIALSAFLYWEVVDASLSWKVLTSVLLIACPCTLLLASSFLHGFLVNKFAAKGFYLKNFSVIEKISRISKILFDKTGTLTEPLPGKVLLQKEDMSAEDEMVFLNLLSLSRHPLCRAVTSQLRTTPMHLQNYKEVEGKGMEVWYDDKHYKAGSAAFVGADVMAEQTSSMIHLSVNKTIIGRYVIFNNLRPGIADMMHKLKAYSPKLLSGDNDYARHSLGKVFPFASDMHFKQSPTQKLTTVLSLQESDELVMMVGDGLNDAGALAQADVGIAVADKSFAFTPACDAIIEATAISHLPYFMRASTKAQSLIIGMLIFSLLYNVIGLYFAVSGQLRPVVAAILMPVSSLSVIALAWVGANHISSHIPGLKKPKHD